MKPKILHDLLYFVEVGQNDKLQEVEMTLERWQIQKWDVFLGSTLFVLQTFLFKRKVSAECKVTYIYFLATENV